MAQVGRVLPVGEADDPRELRDQLAVLMPLALPSTLLADRDIGSGETLALNGNPFAEAIVEVSKFGEEAVRKRFHTELSSVFEASEDGATEHEDNVRNEIGHGEAQA